MGISSLQALSVVIIIYYAPATLVTLWICRRCGFGIHFGWLYLVVLSIARVVGAGLQIAADASRGSGITTAAELIASVGVTSLLLAMLEVIDCIKTIAFRPRDPIPPRCWTCLHLAQYAVFILYIVGMAIPNDSVSTAASLMVAGIFAVQSGIAVWLRIRPESRKCDQRLVTTALLSIPFLAVRVAYGVSLIFVPSDGPWSANVTAMALLQYLMEFVVMGLFLYTGIALFPPKIDRKDSHSEIPMI
ncbi:hypothetical protein FE257_007140 [Aspergillus nanangensis]|uniref:DUF7702 domain-containing protein n=1 Tax=Aspergillus nanangensis TaxID=2582783 RepID=A0AAD4GUD6_ASPNN|nr:hypothetical protein FE257_007140 [Aspergillus nanangensis]